MKRRIFLFVCLVIMGSAVFCRMPKGKITLISPPDHTKDRNVITARLEWNSVCDSFDVYLDTIGRPDQMTRVDTVTHPGYNSGRLEFLTTYYWSGN